MGNARIRKVRYLFLSFILIISCILIPIPKLVHAMNVASLINVDLKQQHDIDVALAVGSTLQNVDNFKDDLQQALRNNGIDLSRVNIRTVETTDNDILTGILQLILYWPNNGQDMDAHLEYWSSSTKVDELYYGKLEVYGSTLDNDDRGGGIGEHISLRLDSIPSNIVELKVYINPFSGSTTSTMYLNKMVNGNFEEVIKYSGDVKYPNKYYFGSFKQNGDSWDFHFQDGTVFLGKELITTTKNFALALRESDWGEGSKKFLVNLHDDDLTELNDTEALGEILSRLENDQIHYIGWGEDTDGMGQNDLTQNQTEQLIGSNNGYGTFVNRNGQTYSEQINAIADYIVQQSRDEASGNYLLQGSKYKMNTTPASEMTNTKDEKWTSGKWRIEHDPSIYENNDGVVPYHDEYLDDLITSFDKVGKYDIYYTDELVTTLYVHRQPLSNFKLEVVNATVKITNLSYDLDLQSQSDAIVEEKWQWKKVSDVSWTSGVPTTFSPEEDYLIQLIVKDQQGAWSNARTRYYSTKTSSVKPIAEFSMNKDMLMGSAKTVSIDNLSYDPRGEAIIEQSWKVYKKDQLIYSGATPRTDFTNESPGLYKLSLVVKNTNGVSSEEFSRFIQIVPNTVPMITTIGDHVIEQGKTKIVNFNVADYESGAYDVAVTATSSDLKLIPTSNIILSGTGKNRTVAIQPTLENTGDVFVTLTVSDGELSSSVTFRVTVIEAVPPSIVSIEPINGGGYYKVGDKLLFKVQFDKPIYVSQQPELILHFFDNTTRYATYTSGHLSTELIFTYTIQAGDNTDEIVILASQAISLLNGNLQDHNQNSVNLGLSANQMWNSIIVDTTPPRSSDATLNSLTVSEGVLSPTFASHIDTYTTSVDSSVLSLEINASPTDAHASVMINGSVTTADTIALTLGQTTSIPIVVTAQDGGKKTYTVNVKSIPVTSTGLLMSPKTKSVTVGDTTAFTVNEEFSDGSTQDRTTNTVFTVSDPSVATMQDNILTAIAPGTVTITATYGSSADTATITVANRVVPSVPQPTPQPIAPAPEPSPSLLSDQILIQRVNDNGEIRYRGYLTLENVQALLQQVTNGGARVVRVRFPAEAAMGATTLDVQRAAGTFLGNQKVDLLIELANGTIRIPHTSLNGWTEELFFRIVPVKSDIHETIEENAQQNEQVQMFIGNRLTVNLLGQPVTIETNLQNQPVTITLPIPTDVTEEQLQTLFVYIEHSDGTTEVKQGRIVEMAPGVQGFAFDVTHFSTFALMYATEQEEVSEEKLVAPYIKGYPDGTFKPNAAVTRAQMATMLARFLTNGDIPTAEATFEDTKNNASKDAIEFVKQTGLFNGTSDTTFDPNGTITRAQMAAVVARWITTTCGDEQTAGYCQEAGKEKAFSDLKASHWAASSIKKVSALGIMTGTSATTFNPNGTLTRAQAVKVLNQLFERPAIEGITESTFSDVPTSHWAIGEIEAAATEMIIK